MKYAIFIYLYEITYNSRLLAEIKMIENTE